MTSGVPKIDMHIHSCYSDGTFTPVQIVKEAKKLGMDLIALTDHNTLAGISSFRKACNKYEQTAVAGIELSTKYKDKEVHLLGYFDLNLDLRDKRFSQLKKIIKNYKNIKKIQNEAILQKIIDVGRYDISIPDFYSFAKCLVEDDNYNRVHIAKYMVYKGLVDSIKEAFDYIGEGCDFFVDKETVPLGKAIKAIQAAGGMVVIAHVGEYDFSPEELALFFSFCKSNGVHGFECYHPSHTEEIASAIIENTINVINTSSINYNFYLTAGSDFHGANKSNKIGDVHSYPFDKYSANIYNLSCMKIYKKMEAMGCI